MRGRLVEDRIEERICKIRVIDGVIANYYPQEELIRCKDCKKRKQCKVATEYYYCDMTGAIVGVSEFCSWAERKEE